MKSTSNPMERRAELDARKHRAEQRLAPYHQDHLWAHWGTLNEGQRDHLLAQVEAVPWEELGPYLGPSVSWKGATSPLPPPDALVPAEAVRLARVGGPLLHGDPYHRRGEALLRQGRVGLLTVAGGQGTRLSFAGPKGAYPVYPVSGHSLFEGFAGAVARAREKWGAPVPWFIMTSPATHGPTVAFFEEHGFFGLPREEVRFFEQGQLPSVAFDGKVLLSSPFALALSPDGHGGLVEALGRQGLLDELQARGVTHLSGFQVDNPLVQAIDPWFLGYCEEKGADLGCKVVEKAHPKEGLSVLCRREGRIEAIEYSDLPDSYAEARQADGALRYRLGNISVYTFAVAFLRRLSQDGVHLPLHRAVKKVACIDGAGNPVLPSAPNAIKLERFLFDVLPLAHRVEIVEVDREDEFAPVKNAKGPDSVETCQQALGKKAQRWLERAGEEGGGGLVEIPPRYALSLEDFVERREAGEGGFLAQGPERTGE